MFKKIALSLVVLALLGETEARSHRHHRHHKRNPTNKRYVQFIDHADAIGDEDNNILNKSAPQSNPDEGLGVRFVQSDPIHGSLGPPKAKREDLTVEQQFEWDQRRIKAPKLVDEEETVGVTNQSIKIAEGIVGAKMPNPQSPEELKKVTERQVQYPHYDSDDEDEDTVETRRSIKTAEKIHTQRFFINAKDQRDYEKKVIDGKISAEELDFKEDKDQEIGQDPKEAEKKEAKKKAAALKKAEEDKADEEDTRTEKEKQKEKKEKEEEEEDKEASKKEEKAIKAQKKGKSTSESVEAKKEATAETKADAGAALPDIPELTPQ